MPIARYKVCLCARACMSRYARACVCSRAKEGVFEYVDACVCVCLGGCVRFVHA